MESPFIEKKLIKFWFNILKTCINASFLMITAINHHQLCVNKNKWKKKTQSKIPTYLEILRWSKVVWEHVHKVLKFCNPGFNDLFIYLLSVAFCPVPEYFTHTGSAHLRTMVETCSSNFWKLFSKTLSQ